MAADELHVGDTPTLTFTVYDGTTAVNLSGATTKTLYMEHPGGTVTTHTLTFPSGSDGTDGQVEYTCSTSDLSTAGVVKMQGYFAWADGSAWHTDLEKPVVYPNLA